MNKWIKQRILFLLSVLPISSIAFAADYDIRVLEAAQDQKEIEAEMISRLDNYELPFKYYMFLKKHKIENTEQLKSQASDGQRNRLVEAYIEDYIDPMSRSGGTISMM